MHGGFNLSSSLNLLHHTIRVLNYSLRPSVVLPFPVHRCLYASKYNICLYAYKYLYESRKIKGTYNLKWREELSVHAVGKEEKRKEGKEKERKAAQHMHVFVRAVVGLLYVSYIINQTTVLCVHRYSLIMHASGGRESAGRPIDRYIQASTEEQAQAEAGRLTD